MFVFIDSDEDYSLLQTISIPSAHDTPPQHAQFTRDFPRPCNLLSLSSIPPHPARSHAANFGVWIGNRRAKEAAWVRWRVAHSVWACPVVPSFRALSGRLKFTVRRHKFNKYSLPWAGLAWRPPGGACLMLIEVAVRSSGDPDPSTFNSESSSLNLIPKP